MSCVAEANATASAHHTTTFSPVRGSDSAMPTSAAMIAPCDSISQLRRRPIQRVSKGMGSRSTSGDQHHLKPYASPTQLR
ncbi:hypothetical protein D9M69_517990 [compost metagenome]